LFIDQTINKLTTTNQQPTTTNNFSTALHFSIDPEQNRLKKAVFSPDNLEGLLDKYQLKMKRG
jgi:hypothetical protein